LVFVLPRGIVHDRRNLCYEQKAARDGLFTIKMPQPFQVAASVFSYRRKENGPDAEPASRS
jgi:hypothetical protein